MIALIVSAPLLATAVQDQEPAHGAARPPRQSQVEQTTNALRRAEKVLSSGYFRHRPWVARQRGLDPTDRGEIQLGAEASVAWRNLLDAAPSDLAAAPYQDLSPRRRVDLDWLLAWVEAETVLAHAIPSERWDPSWYVGEIAMLLQGLADAQPSGSRKHIFDAMRMLQRVPVLLAEGRETLSAPDPTYSEMGILQATELVYYLETDFLSRVRPGLLPDPMDRLAFRQAHKRAVTALNQYRDWMAKVDAEEPGGPIRLGEREWGQVVRAISGSELSPGDLKVELVRGIAAYDDALGQRRHLRPPPIEERRPPVVIERVTEASGLGRDFPVRLGILDPGSPNVVCRTRNALVHPGLLATLRGGTRPVLELVYTGNLWPQGIRLSRSSAMDPHALTVTALRYGFPGEALWQVWSRSNDRLTQRALWNRCQREGWGLYAAEWITRPGIATPFQGKDNVRVEVMRALMVEASRLLASLEYHHEGLPVKRVVENFRLNTGLDIDTARFEVRSVLMDPLYGIGYVGFLELQSLEEEAAHETTELQALKQTVRLVSRHPSARVVDLRTHLEGNGD